MTGAGTAADGAGTPHALAYCVPEFPSQTHAFFWREIQALEGAGVPLKLFSTRRPAEGACPHAFAARAEARTTYLFPPDPVSVRRVLARRRRNLPGALAYVAGLRETGLHRRARLLGLIPSAAMLLDRCERAGIAHAHFHSMADCAHLGALANILGGLSYSLTLHGDLPVYGCDHARKMARAALVTAVTAPLAAQLRAISPEREAPVIRMGVDTDRFTPGEPRRSGAAPLHAATVARLNRTKGHRFFLEAMARAVAEGLDIRYSIAGEGPYRAELEAEIRGFGLENRVELLGSLGEDDVLALLRRADIFALTSIGQGEAAPVSVMEAMACGLPVICSRIGGTPDMISDGVHGFLVEQGDVGEVLAALRRLSLEETTRARLSLAARARAVEAFDHRVKARELRDALLAAGALAGEGADGLGGGLCG